MSKHKTHKCECIDHGCAAHRNSTCSEREDARASVNLRRVDMHDVTGTNFCRACADDAHESGLFYGDRKPR